MSYEPVDQSIDGGAPEEFYVFQVEAATYRYTNGPREKTVEGDLYLPRQVQRSAIVNNLSALDNSNITVSLPIDDEVSRRSLGIVTPTALTIEIYAIHRTDGDEEYKRLYAGYVMDITSDDRLTTFALGSLLQSHTEAPVVTVMYSPVCNHEWGDSHCQVIPADFSTGTTVAAIDIFNLTLSDFAGSDMSDYNGGYIINARTGVSRPIVSIDGNLVFLPGAFVDIAVGDPVTLYQGCDHIIDGDCKNRFNNVANFGGFPFVPRKNPFVMGFNELDLSNPGADM